MKKNTEEIIHPDNGSTSEEHQIRLQKLAAMQEAGINPWPEFKSVNATAQEVIEAFKDEQESPIYEIAGRLMTLRKHGKTIFAHLQDRTGTIQIYIRQDDIGENLFHQFDKFVDVGDIVWVKGSVFRTKMGEITVKVQEFQLISKCLHPLPDKFHGLVDIETKYRQRYLDLIMNKESRERFYKRSQIIKVMRNFLDKHGFVEVETPMLHPIPGGAIARPFVTHHNALDMDLYLRIAPELYLKRLVIGGMERVYEINRCFRNEGISTKHNPEFTTIELYIAHKDYHWMMDFSEKMFQEIVRHVNGDMVVPYGDHHIDFGKPFERISMHDAVVKYANISPKDLAKNNIDATLKKHDVVLDKKSASWGEKLYALFDVLVESKLIQPTFITHFPIEASPLAKRDPENPDFVLRFEMFVAGMELSNAFNELNDPFDQAERFREQAKAKEAGDVEAHYYDADYVQALEYGLPPTVGYGAGIDRLAMLLTNTPSIKDVILFPTLKHK
jgi:lysyl-tRNA synthetase class 2